MTNAESMSVFLAHVPCFEMRQAIHAFVERHANQFGNFNYTNADQYHLTLLFVGTIDKARLPALVEAMTQVCQLQARFELTLGGIDAFPNQRHPRVLWAGVTGGIEPLIDLHQSMTQGLDQAGISYDREPLVPHVTVGRVLRHGSRESIEEAIEQLGNVDFGPMPVQQVELFSSEKISGTYVYRQIAVAHLA